MPANYDGVPGHTSGRVDLGFVESRNARSGFRKPTVVLPVRFL
jgi:hypothetical protein